MKKYKFYFGMGLVGCKKEEIFFVEDFGFTDEEWKNLENEEKEELLQEAWETFIWENIDGGWKEI